MKILFLSSSSDWHIDLWTNYFTKTHHVFLFSDKEDYLIDEDYQGVTVVQSNGYFGAMLNLIKSSSHKFFQLNKLFSVKYFAKKIQQLVKDNGIEVVHAHNLYFGYLASFLPREIPVIFTPMGSDIILHAQNNFLYRHMANKAFSRANIVTGDSKLVQSQGTKWALGGNIISLFKMVLIQIFFIRAIIELKKNMEFLTTKFFFLAPEPLRLITI